jgi:ribosome-binding factor A
MTRRTQRVADAAKEVIAALLLKDVKDPRIGMVTLTTVEVSPDLRHARVLFSVLGDETKRKESLAGLRSASGFIRREVARQLRLRAAPELLFEFDPSLEYAERLSRLLKDVLPDEADS